MERVSSAIAAAEVEDAISTDQSGRSGKKRAKVWAYVDTEFIDGVEKAVCKYCKLQLSSVSGTLEALVCAKDWLFGLNDADEGQPLTGQRMFESDEEEDAD